MGKLNQWKLYGALGALYVLWGSTYFAIRVAVTHVPPLTMASWRYLVAGILLFVLLRLRGAAMPTWRQWRDSAVVGFLLLTVANASVGVAEQWISSGLAAVMIATTPLWSAVFLWAWGDRPQRSEWWGIAAGILGVMALQSGQGLHGSLLGAALLVLAPLSWAFGSVLGKRLDLPKGPMGSAAQMLTAGALLVPVSLLFGETWPTHVAPAGLAAIAYLVVFGSLIGYSCYVYLLAHMRPTTAMSYAYVNPLVALLLGAGFGGEHLSAHDWVGSGIVLLAVVMLIRSKAAPVAAPQPGQAKRYRPNPNVPLPQRR
jgi:drug/metabolite transporter (DMT)-like permease